MAFDRPIAIITIACEASSESHECRQAVIASIRNRRDSGRFEPTISGVCMQRYQYSEYLPDRGDNSNLERILALSDDHSEILDAGKAYDEVMADSTLDPSQGATHFVADSIPLPSWAVSATQTVKIGHVMFFKNVP